MFPTFMDTITKRQNFFMALLAFFSDQINTETLPFANKEVLHGLVQNDIFEVVEGRHVFMIDLFKRWILKNLAV